jgi:hypothetical protein
MLLSVRTKKIARIRIAEVILIFILLTGFSLRLAMLQYPFQKNDARRDHVVARHIVTYHEFPLTGPYNAFTGGKNSPAYFYLLSSFLLINNSFVFLSIVNIALQIITIYFVFILAKGLFGEQTALLSAFLITFNLFALRQSSYIWQPWIMQPLIILSFILILHSHTRKNYAYLIGGVAAFILAGAIHNAAFVLSPFITLATMGIMRHLKAKKKHYVGLIICIGVLLVVLYSSLISHYFIYPPPNFISTINTYIAPVAQGLINLPYNISYFVSSMLFDLEETTVPIYFLAFIICALLLYYLYSLGNKKEKFYSLLIALSIGLIIFLISMIDVKAFKYFFGSHYFTPVFGLFIILLSRILTFTFLKNNAFKLLGIFMLSLYMGIFFSSSYNKFAIMQKTFSLRPASVPAVEAIKTEVINIKKSGNYNSYHFFKIEIYADNNHGWKYSPTVWAILEEDLDTKFVRVDDNDPMSFRPINNSSENIFLVCPASPMYESSQSGCVDAYLEKNKNAVYVKRVFSEMAYSIDLIKMRN